MNKFKFAVFAGAAAAIAIVSVFAAHADTTPLAVTCAGSVSSNQITWTASATGGNAPYNFVWSGDSSVAGSTSTSIAATYGTNATYTADIQAMDASSTVATSTCSATVTANPIVVVTPTSTLNVFVSVNNTAGGSAVPSSFAVTVSGANATPSSFSGNSVGTAVVVNASTTYSVSAFAITNYAAGESGNCSGPLAAGSNGSCTITETYVVPPVTPTSTPPLPRVNPPSLSIGTDGAFLARGMTVTSVASGSFQAEVWGVTYTINWSGNLFPEFYFRNGNGGNATSSPTTQVAVGDEVGVSGKVTSANPMVVTASVVRDYSITQPRPHPMPMPFQNGNGGGNGNNGNGKDNGSNSSSVNVDFSARLGNLMNQLHSLQNLFKGHK